MLITIIVTAVTKILQAYGASLFTVFQSFSKCACFFLSRSRPNFLDELARKRLLHGLKTCLLLAHFQVTFSKKCKPNINLNTSLTYFQECRQKKVIINSLSMRRRNFIINSLLKHSDNTMIYKYTDFEEDERSNACIDREILGENVLAVLIQLKIRFNTVSYILFQVRGGAC